MKTNTLENKAKKQSSLTMLPKDMTMTTPNTKNGRECIINAELAQKHLKAQKYSASYQNQTWVPYNLNMKNI